MGHFYIIHSNHCNGTTIAIISVAILVTNNENQTPFYFSLLILKLNQLQLTKAIVMDGLNYVTQSNCRESKSNDNRVQSTVTS